VANANQLKIIFRHVIVGALDLNADPLSRFEQDAVRADLDVEFVNLVGL
jgi:hypothetical protein